MSQWLSPDKRKFDTVEAWVILLMVGPGIWLLVAGLLQATYRWVWPVVLVLVVGSVAAYVGLLVLGLYEYHRHESSLFVVYVYLIALLLTVAASVVNAILELVPRFSNRGAEQTIVGPEPPPASFSSK